MDLLFRDIVQDPSPQLGGNLDSNANTITMADNDAIRFGTGTDVSIAWDATDLEVTGAIANQTINLRDGHHLALWDSTDTDNVDFHHDGTDLNIVGTTTTDINITGITAIQAGTVDADFDVITGTSVTVDASTAPGATFNIPHGVAPTVPTNGDIWTTTTSVYARVNGVTKDLAAAGGGGLNNVVEDLSPQLGADLDSNTFNIDMQDNDAVVFGTGSDVTVQWDGVDLEVTGALANQSINLRDGHHLLLWDSTDTDNVDFHHDGTDFNITGTTTTDINITGITAIQAPAVDADFDAITGTSVGVDASQTGGATLNVPHGVAPTSPVNGDIWTTTTSVYARVNGVTKDLAAAGGGGITGSGTDNRIMRWNGTGAAQDTNHTIGDDDSLGGGSTANGGTISATALGAVALGRANYGAVTASGVGSFAQGVADAAGSSIVAGTGIGGMARGYASDGDILTGTYGRGAFASGYVNTASASIVASDRGSHAMGFADGNADISATNRGSIAMGNAYGNGSLITSTGYGTFALGRCYSGGDITSGGRGSVAFGYSTGATSSIINSNYGSLAFGYASGNGTINASNAGAVAGGEVAGSGDIRSAGPGCIAFGSATTNGQIYCSNLSNGAVAMGFAQNTSSYIRATGSGSIAMGASNSGYQIYSTGIGSIAMGKAFDGNVESSADGSIALGYAQDAHVRATADGAVAMGHSNTAQVSYGIWAGGAGSFAMGSATGGSIYSNAAGGFAMGRTTFNVYSGYINCYSIGSLVGGHARRRTHQSSAGGDGSLVWGYSTGAGAAGIALYGHGKGSVALGYVQHADSVIGCSAAGDGGFAHGHANGADITVTAVGGTAFGHAVGGNISVAGDGGFAVGQGPLTVAAAADGGSAFGSGAQASHLGAMALSSGEINAIGDNQSFTVTLGIETTKVWQRLDLYLLMEMRGRSIFSLSVHVLT
jgi:hypothetical protein